MENKTSSIQIRLSKTSSKLAHFDFGKVVSKCIFFLTLHFHAILSVMNFCQNASKI